MLKFQVPMTEPPFRRKLAQEEFIAWKVVADFGRSCKSAWRGLHRRNVYFPGQEYTAGGVRMKDYADQVYELGFHCMARLSDARKERKVWIEQIYPHEKHPATLRIMKVRIRSEDVTAVGMDEAPEGYMIPTVVARKLRVVGVVR